MMEFAGLICKHRLFAIQFGLPVYALWISRICLYIRFEVFAIKNIVC